MQLNLKRKLFRPANTLEVKKVIYAPKIKAKPKLLLSDSSSSFISEANSFLQETDHNSDIDDRIREEIEERFSRSPINSSYRFPRLEDRLPKLSQSPSRRSHFPHNKYLEISLPRTTVNPKQFEGFISNTNKFQYSMSKSPKNHIVRYDTENPRIAMYKRRIQTPVQELQINRKGSKIRHSRSGSDMDKLLDTTAPFKTMKLAKTIRLRPRSRVMKRNESPAFKLSSKTPSPNRLKLLLKAKLV